MIKGTTLMIAALLAQQVAARLSLLRVDGEFGRKAKADRFLSQEISDEDKAFWDRALAGHEMSMSMSMSMGMGGSSGMSMDMSMSMPMYAEEETMTVYSASGSNSENSSSNNVDSAAEVDASPEVPLEPSALATDDAGSSASKASIGVSCFVAAVAGSLLL